MTGARSVGVVTIVAALVASFALGQRAEPDREQEGDHGACKVADFWLKRYLLEHDPRLADPEVGDFEKVSILRRWASAHADRAAPELQLTKPHPRAPGLDYFKADAASIFHAFEEDRGGVMCGGNSWALLQLYRAFGYDGFD